MAVANPPAPSRKHGELMPAEWLFLWGCCSRVSYVPLFSGVLTNVECFLGVRMPRVYKPVNKPAQFKGAKNRMLKLHVQCMEPEDVSLSDDDETEVTEGKSSSPGKSYPSLPDSLDFTDWSVNAIAWAETCRPPSAALDPPVTTGPASYSSFSTSAVMAGPPPKFAASDDASAAGRKFA
jgi:hypothetical protein